MRGTFVELGLLRRLVVAEVPSWLVRMVELGQAEAVQLDRAAWAARAQGTVRRWYTHAEPVDHDPAEHEAAQRVLALVRKAERTLKIDRLDRVEETLAFIMRHREQTLYGALQIPSEMLGEPSTRGALASSSDGG